MSLPHSGSTLLSLLLSSHGAAIGLAEGIQCSVDCETELGDSLQCSCGAAAGDCMFWGPVKRRLAKLGKDASRDERIDAHLAQVGQSFADATCVVDSSKHTWLPAKLARRQDIDYRVVLLVRDVRSWTVSHRRLAVERDSTRFKDRNAWLLFGKWYRRNKELIDLFEREGIGYFITTYDSFCLNPEIALASMCRFLNLEFDPAMLAPRIDRQHFLKGNPMIGKVDLNRRVIYDDRWLYDDSWLAPALLRRGIMKFNREMAGSSPGSSWKHRQ